MNRSSSMTATFALRGADGGMRISPDGMLAGSPASRRDVFLVGSQGFTKRRPGGRGICDMRERGRGRGNAEGLQSRAGVPVVPGGGDRVARHAAPRRARARSARDQLEAV